MDPIRYYTGNPNDGEDNQALIADLPAGRDLLVQAEANANLYFWNAALGGYSATAIVVSAPGEAVPCYDAKLKITGDTDVVITLSNGANVAKL